MKVNYYNPFVDYVSEYPNLSIDYFGDLDESSELVQQLREVHSFITKTRRLPLYGDIKWLDEYRAQFVLGTLKQHIIDGFNTIFDWEWKISHHWCEKFHQSAHFIKTHDRLPKSNELSWVLDQCKIYYNGLLKPYQIKALESLPHWEWRSYPAFDYTVCDFIRDVEILKEYVSKYNRIPRRKYGFAFIRKIQKRYKLGLLMECQIKSLEDIPGWKWESSREDNWNKNFQLLSEFVDINKRFPQRYEMLWFEPQYAKYKRMKLNNEQINLFQILVMRVKLMKTK